MKTNSRLAKSLALGRKRYIILHGVLGWGLLTALLVTGWSFYRKEEMSAAKVIITFIVFPISGIFLGACTWSILKKKHDEATAQKPR